MSVEEIYGKCTLLAAPQAPGTRQLESGTWKWLLGFKIQNSSRFIFFLFATYHTGVYPRYFKYQGRLTFRCEVVTFW